VVDNILYISVSANDSHNAFERSWEDLTYHFELPAVDSVREMCSHSTLCWAEWEQCTDLAAEDLADWEWRRAAREQREASALKSGRPKISSGNAPTRWAPSSSQLGPLKKLCVLRASDMADEGTLRIMERAVPWTHLCFRDGVSEVSLTFVKDLMRRKDKRATRGSVADKFFGGRYRSSGTAILRLSPESYAARAANPFAFGAERMRGGVRRQRHVPTSRAPSGLSRTLWCAWPTVRVTLRATSCGKQRGGALMKLSSSWPPQAKARQPLSPVDDDDAILYAPPETSRGVRGDTYGWIPDTCCGVYHIEGGD
jgi:hypothetical protein